MKKLSILLLTLTTIEATTPDFKTICNTTTATSSSSQLAKLCKQYGYGMKPDNNVLVLKHQQQIDLLARKIELLTGKKVEVNYDANSSLSSKTFYIKFKLNKDSLAYSLLKNELLASRYAREVLKPMRGVYLTNEYDLIGDYIVELEGNISGKSLGLSSFRVYSEYNGANSTLLVDDIGMINNLFNINNLALNSTQNESHLNARLALFKMQVYSFIYAQGMYLNTSLDLDDNYNKNALALEVNDIKVQKFIEHLNGKLKIATSLDELSIDTKGYGKSSVHNFKLDIHHKSGLKLKLKTKAISIVDTPVAYNDEAYMDLDVGLSRVSLKLEHGVLSMKFHNLHLKNNRTIKDLNIDTIWSKELEGLSLELQPMFDVLNSKSYSVQALGVTIDRALDNLIDKIAYDIDGMTPVQ